MIMQLVHCAAGSELPSGEQGQLRTRWKHGTQNTDTNNTNNYNIHAWIILGCLSSDGHWQAYYNPQWCSKEAKRTAQGSSYLIWPYSLYAPSGPAGVSCLTVSFPSTQYRLWSRFGLGGEEEGEEEEKEDVGEPATNIDGTVRQLFSLSLSPSLFLSLSPDVCCCRANWA